MGGLHEVWTTSWKGSRRPCIPSQKNFVPKSYSYLLLPRRTVFGFGTNHQWAARRTQDSGSQTERSYVIVLDNCWTTRPIITQWLWLPWQEDRRQVGCEEPAKFSLQHPMLAATAAEESAHPLPRMDRGSRLFTGLQCLLEKSARPRQD